MEDNFLIMEELIFVCLQYIFIIVGSGYLSKCISHKGYCLAAIPIAVVVASIYSQVNIIATVLLFLIISSLIFYYIKKAEAAFFYVSITLLTYIASDYFLVGFLTIMDSEINVYVRFLLGSLIFSVILMLIKKMLAIFKSKFFNSQSFRLILSLAAIITLSVYFIDIYVERMDIDKLTLEQINAGFILGYAIFSLVICLLVGIFLKKSFENKEKQKELEYQLEYSKKVEHDYNEMRKLKHDYKNILLSIEDYINREDIPGLTNYFYSEIKGSSQAMEQDLFKLSQLSNIQISELKSIFINKLIRSQNLKIDTEIEVKEIIDSIGLEPLILVRAMGIILDNAIEAAQEIPNGFIRVAVFKKSEQIIIVVANTYEDSLSPLYLLKRSGYSTKGKNRGLGLSNLDEMFLKINNVILDTRVENGIFTQILEIGGI